MGYIGYQVIEIYEKGSFNMAKATVKEETKVTEEVLKDDVAGNAAVEAVEVPSVKKSNRVTVVIPRYLFTSDPIVEHHEVCLNGKIYQVKYDEPVEVPKGVADVINNAIAQKKKVQGIINKLNGKAKEIQG